MMLRGRNSVYSSHYASSTMLDKPTLPESFIVTRRKLSKHSSVKGLLGDIFIGRQTAGAKDQYTSIIIFNDN